MKRLLHYWDSLRGSYWFVPSVMTAGAILLALGLVRLDTSLGDAWLSELSWIYTGSADGARQLLATVAGSMITVAGVVFSVTTVALSLATSQFGSRLLRNFMRDRGNQFVLGTFIATFVYCLLVLRTIRGEERSEFVPHAAVTAGVVLALLSVFVLIYFIHHAAVSMQAPTIIANVGAELRECIETMYAERDTAAEDDGDLPPLDELRTRLASSALPLRSNRNGYVQSIDEQALVSRMYGRGVIELLHRPGHFVVKGEPLARVLPPTTDEREDWVESLRDAFIVGEHQTALQDPEFAVNQLVEVAVRALSPGINDPFTAIGCIDYLGAGLATLAGRKMPPGARCDAQGQVRLLRYPMSFADIADTAIRQIRQYGRTSAAVLVRLLQTVEAVLEFTQREADRAALLRQAQLIRDAAAALPQEADRADVEAAYRRAVNAPKHPK